MSDFTNPRTPDDKLEHNDTEDLLNAILNELKIMNSHFTEWDGEEQDDN